MNDNMCQGIECASEGIYDQKTGALYCDDCGKPDVNVAMTRLSKSLMRQDDLAELRRYAILASATWAVALLGIRP